ncbi:hypothetical protein DFH06DRAFT_1154354 [Mycena polygramma]|nr:hypothetical protein DFH06DRAFT_1154354 [Mycena polygramma]
MARGRPRLDPDIKQQHRQESRRRYDEDFQNLRHAEERREAARLRMQRRRATIANSDLNTRGRYARKVAAAAMNYRHRKLQLEYAEAEAASAAKKKARRSEAHTLRMKHASNPKAAAALRPAPSKLKKKAVHLITEHPALAPPGDRPLRCPHCHEEDCIGCACMCADSNEWFEHADGHFFPTCQACGQECPGCKCVCPNSSVWRDHGGVMQTAV